MIFDLDSVRIFSAATLEISLFCHIAIWIAVTDYYMQFYLIERSLLTAIFMFINFTPFITFSLQINTVILLGMGQYQKCVHREVTDAKLYQFRDSEF